MTVLYKCHADHNTGSLLCKATSLAFTAYKPAPGNRTPDHAYRQCLRHGHDTPQHNIHYTVFSHFIVFPLNLPLHQMLEMSTILLHAGFTSLQHILRHALQFVP